ncbi:MAG: hypothetical protein MUF72_05760 [Elainella sp. Prado103]|nr:hypothetical protein [Elainella sp. Prado103]
MIWRFGYHNWLLQSQLALTTTNWLLQPIGNRSASIGKTEGDPPLTINVMIHPTIRRSTRRSPILTRSAH